MDNEEDAKPRQSTTDRLTQEIWRMRLRSRGLWATVATLVVVLALFALAYLDTPHPPRYLSGTAGPTTVLPTDDGSKPVLRVEFDGQTRTAHMSSRLVHPRPGEPVCIAVGERRLTGRMTLRVAPPDPLCRCNSDSGCRIAARNNTLAGQG